jgi:hypothetical protein
MEKVLAVHDSGNMDDSAAIPPFHAHPQSVVKNFERNGGEAH